MRPGGFIRTGLRTVGLVVGTLLWCAVTLWYGVVGLWKAALFLAHVRQTFSRKLLCPRGHVMDAFGPLRCGRCHAASVQLAQFVPDWRSEEHTSELQSLAY